MNKYYFILFFLAISNLVLSQNAILVKDIHPGGFENGFKPTNLYNFNNKLFFGANEGIHGNELWVSDGTEDGTHLIKDLYPGPESGNPNSFIEFNGLLYFIANSGIGYNNIWKTDGTNEGTEIFMPNLIPYNLGPGKVMGIVNNLMFFSADDGIHGVELWATDGTVEGTYLVKNIDQGTYSSVPHNFFKFNDNIVFNVLYKNGQSNIEPWISDGTEQGTNLIKNIGGSASSDPQNFAQMGDELFFSARHSQSGRELWKTDGTEIGTVLVKDIYPGAGNPFFGPNYLTVFNNKLYFNMMDGTFDRELWHTDGTQPNTIILKNINPSYSSDPRYLTEYNNQLFFIANDGTHGGELWFTDGTEQGTQLFYDLYPGHFVGAKKNLIVYNGWLYFIGTDNYTEFGDNWWKTDGTVESLTPIYPLYSNYTSPFPVASKIVESNGKLFFVACYDTSIGFELYVIEDENLNLHNNTSKLDFKFYPNPVDDFLYLESEFLIKNIDIYSTLGHKIMNLKNNDTSLRLNMSTLKKGNYFLKITGTDLTVIKKIIKN
tara:strand:- start:7257 stop:8891 length:1635 start_codon:yes stop_codon:yes gene_type:complete